MRILIVGADQNYCGIAAKRNLWKVFEKNQKTAKREKCISRLKKIYIKENRE